MNMKAKVRINHIDARNADNGIEILHMNPVAASKYPADGSDENNTYAKFTPSGVFQLTITNPNLIGKFAVGEEYYLDFTKA